MRRDISYNNKPLSVLVSLEMRLSLAQKRKQNWKGWPFLLDCICWTAFVGHGDLLMLPWRLREGRMLTWCVFWFRWMFSHCSKSSPSVSGMASTAVSFSSTVIPSSSSSSSSSNSSNSSNSMAHGSSPGSEDKRKIKKSPFGPKANELSKRKQIRAEITTLISSLGGKQKIDECQQYVSLITDLLSKEALQYYGEQRQWKNCSKWRKIELAKALIESGWTPPDD
jgi:hypothetical protein